MSKPPESGSPPTYTDTGDLRPQDDVDLDTFVSLRDRAKLLDGKGPPFFSGRENEIQVFFDMLDDVQRGILADSTYVIVGPPGAGKTALMAQCMSEVAARPPTADGRSWLPVVVHSSVANSAQALGREIDRAIAKHMASPAGKARRNRLLAEIEDMGEGLDPAEASAAKDAIGLVKRAVGALKGETASHSDAIFDQVAGKIAELLSRHGRGRALTIAKNILNRGVSFTGFSIGPSRNVPDPAMTDVVQDRQGAWHAFQTVLFVDEGQNIPSPASPDSGQSSALSFIHEDKAGAPLSLCVFGLHGTWNALKRVGISRTVAERDIRLGELSESDCAMAAHRCFSQFRIANGEGWQRAIVSRAKRWPQHLAGYLVAAMKELRQQDNTGGGYDARSADFERVIAAGDRTREEYYTQRASGLGDNRYVELAAQVAAVLRSSGGLKASEVDRLLAETGGSMEKDEERTAFLSAAYKAGLLSYDPVEQRTFLPIPSFAGFLLKEAPEPVPDVLVSDNKGQYMPDKASRRRRSRSKAGTMRP